MNKIIFLFGYFYCCLLNNISAQDDGNLALMKVIPPSPNSAALGKFGSVPVSYFTGQANTSIPLFEYGKGVLKGDVSLSYSPGGIKVEEVSSWVGVGWALNAGGLITRTIRGIADEKAFGYFNTDMTAKFMMDHYQDTNYHSDIVYRHEQAAIGMYDLEPDIFVFNFGGNSGKFFYNQETENFYTMTRSKLKISFNAADTSFLIQAPNGNKYYFTIKETTTTNTTTCYTDGVGSPSGNYSVNITSWLLSRIENSNNTENITFEYNNTGSYTFNTIMTHVKYLPLANVSGEGPDMKDVNCESNITISSKKLSAIYWNNGSLKFKSVNDRADLSGEKTLDTIKLYNAGDSNIRNFVFKYGYFSGDTLSSKLRLDSLFEVDKAGIQNSPYTFEYESGSFPSRLSYAQDYWGYYNGETSNTSLIPPTYLVNTGLGGYWVVPGAERRPVLSYAKTGALNKVNYPTGGYTQFTYECNEATNLLLPPDYTTHYEHLEGDHNGGQQTYYETEFTIDVPPNYYNGLHDGGGIYPHFYFTEIGCIFPGGVANDSAVLSVTNLSDLSSVVITDPSQTSIYLPNGTYRLSASFNQGNNPGFEDFYFSISWEQPDLSHHLAGGLRIQKILDYDGIDHAHDNIRTFEYLNEDSTCSGSFIGLWDGIFHFDFQTLYSTGNAGFEVDTWHRFNSESNYPLVSEHGNYVTYSRVTEYEGENGRYGKTVYSFKTYNDFIDQFPFPHVEKEWARGQLLTKTAYENRGNTFYPVSETINTYQSSNDNDSAATNMAIGIKQGVYKQFTGGGGGLPTELHDEWLVPAFNYSGTISGLTLQDTTNTIANVTPTNEGIETKSIFGYDELNFAQNRITNTNSKGDSITTRITYPVDYTGSIPDWLNNLKNNNLLSVPIEKTVVKKVNGTEYLISATLSIYKDDQPLPYKIYSIDLATPLTLDNFTPAYISSGNLVKDTHYKERISFTSYDSVYNLLEQQKNADVKQSYIWDYSNSYPVAEVFNASSDRIAYSSFESNSQGNWSFNSAGKTNSYSLTGGNAYTITSHTISKSTLPSGNYIVSYWSRNGSMSVNSGSGTAGRTIDGWTYYEHVLTNISTVTITGSGIIDELRLYPTSAQMSTLTFEPLVGVTSQCDKANRIIYYEYDNLNRLALIRDQDKKIIKRIDYKYQATPLQ